MPDYKEILYEKAARRRFDHAQSARCDERDQPQHDQRNAASARRSRKKTAKYAPSCSPAPGARFPPAWTREIAPAGAAICTGPTASSPDKPPRKSSTRGASIRAIFAACGSSASRSSARSTVGPWARARGSRSTLTSPSRLKTPSSRNPKCATARIRASCGHCSAATRTPCVTVSPAITSMRKKRCASVWSSKSCQPDQLIDECFKIVERIAHVPPETVKINLHVATMGLDMMGLRDALTYDKQMSAPAHVMLREELRKPLDDARANKGIREYLQMRDGPFQPEPFGPRAKKKANEAIGGKVIRSQLRFQSK